MAKRRNKPRDQGRDDTSIRFEGLHGEDDDDAYIDPLDAEPGERGEGEDEDPYAEDPFSDRTVDLEDRGKATKTAAAAKDGAEDGGSDDDDDEPGDVADDKDADADAGKGEDAPPITDPGLQSMVDRQAQEIEKLRRDADLSRKQAEEANKTLYETRAKDVDDQLTRARADLEKAIEDGETKRQVELQDRLAELHAAKGELKSLREQGERSAEERPAERSEPEMPQIRAQTPAAERWMQGRTWINSPAYAEQNKELLRIARVLVEDGYDVNQTDYYEELERRMKRRYPALFGNGQPTRPQRRPDRQTVGRVSRDDPPSQRSSGKITLDREDLRNMQRFGLDTNDKEALREYARAKQQSEREERYRRMR